MQDDSVSSEIGSYDPRDATTLVVSTAAGTNDAAGSSWQDVDVGTGQCGGGPRW